MCMFCCWIFFVPWTILNFVMNNAVFYLIHTVSIENVTISFGLKYVFTVGDYAYYMYLFLKLLATNLLRCEKPDITTKYGMFKYTLPHINLPYLFRTPTYYYSTMIVSDYVHQTYPPSNHSNCCNYSRGTNCGLSSLSQIRLCCNMMFHYSLGWQGSVTLLQVCITMLHGWVSGLCDNVAGLHYNVTWLSVRALLQCCRSVLQCYRAEFQGSVTRLHICITMLHIWVSGLCYNVAGLYYNVTWLSFRALLQCCRSVLQYFQSWNGWSVCEWPLL